MANSINWLGNSVVDPGMTRQAPRTTMPANPPAGYPLGPEAPLAQDQFIQPDMFMTREGPPPVMNRLYIPGYLAANIGKNIRAEFFVGENQSVDKAGRLVEVGVNYFVIQDVLAPTLVMCDLYSVKFVTIYPT